MTDTRFYARPRPPIGDDRATAALLHCADLWRDLAPGFLGAEEDTILFAVASLSKRHTHHAWNVFRTQLVPAAQALVAWETGLTSAAEVVGEFDEWGPEGDPDHRYTLERRAEITLVEPLQTALWHLMCEGEPCGRCMARHLDWRHVPPAVSEDGRCGPCGTEWLRVQERAANRRHRLLGAVTL